MAYKSGRHFLQIPGPSPVPDRILRAMDMPVIDHRGPDFGKLGGAGSGKAQGRFQNRKPGHRLSGKRHRRMGSGTRQCAEPRR